VNGIKGYTSLLNPILHGTIFDILHYLCFLIRLNAIPQRFYMRIFGLILPWLLLSSSLLAQMQISNITSTPAGCSSNGTVTVTVSGGTPIYCYQINGSTCYYSAASTYTFTDLASGTKNITITDGPNTATITATIEVQGNYQSPSLFGLPQGCGVYAQASGGLPPYQYSISKGGGAFSALQGNPQFTPIVGNYCLRVYDACNNFTEYCGFIDISPVEFTPECCDNSANPNEICVQFTDRQGLHANDPGYWFGGQPPYLYSATAAGVTVTNPDGYFNLQQLCPGWAFSITDGCGNTITKTPNCMKTEVLCVDCDAGMATINTANGVAPYVYFYQDAAGQWQPNPAGGTNGNFSGLPAPSANNSYTFRAIDACGNISPPLEVQCIDGKGYFDCLAQTVRIEALTSFFPASVTCSTCPSAPTIILPQPGFASFPLPSGSSSNTFLVTDACGATVTINCKDTLPDMSIQKSCNTIFARMRSNYVCDGGPPTPYSIEGGVLYTIALATQPSIIIASNSTGVFTNLNAGVTYVVTATHGVCGAAVVQVTLFTNNDFNLNTALKTTSFIQNGICQTGYQVLASLSPSPEIAPVFELIGSVAYQDSTGLFTDISPGTWTLNSSNYCLSQSLVLPDWKPEMTVQMPECPNGGCVQMSGARTPSEWASWGAGFGLNIESNSDFYILDCPGFNGPQCVANWGGNICNLIPGNSYEVYLKPGTFTCPVDTISFIVDPSGTARIDSVMITTPVACTETSLAGSLVTIIGGKAPLYLEVIDSITGLVLRTFYDLDNDRKIAVDSLKALETYFFRVVDACNNTKDISATVILLPGVTASYTRRCDATITLETAAIFNAIYTWKDAAGVILDTGANKWKLQTNALTTTTNYAVEINFGNCLTHVTGVNVPAYVPAQVTLPFSDTLFCNVFALDVVATTGSGSYTYLWNTGSTNSAINTTVQGFFEVIATDVYGCSDTANAMINSSPPILLNWNTKDVPCYNGKNGSANITVMGGTLPFDYIWENGVTTASRSNLSAGPYSVTVTDAKGCSQTQQLLINEPDSLEITLSAVHITCFGGSDGSAQAIASGGIAPYSFTWGNGISGNIKNALQQGVYTVTCTDANGCTRSDSISITQPDALIINYIFTPIPCYGDSTGGIAVVSSGGTGTINYVWSVPNGTNGVLQNVPAGNYQLTATDQNNCSVTDNIILSQPEILALTITGNNISCFGGANGSLSATTMGGTQPLSVIVWNTGEIGNTISSLTADSYSATIMDANLCTATATYQLTEPPLLTVSLATAPTSCHNSTDGTAIATPTGGTPTYQYQWSIGGFNTPSVQQLPAASYTVTITDTQNCTTTATQLVNAPSPLTLDYSTEMVSCNGASNGIITTIPAGGTPLYTYKWSNNATTNGLQDLSIGNYIVTLTDQNNCAIVENILITEPLPLTFTAVNTTNAGCAGNEGAVAVIATGGTGTYSGNWSDSQTGLSIQGLASGNYTITITDSNGCSITTSTSIGGVAPLEVEVSAQPISCFGATDGAIFFESITGGIGPPYFLDDMLLPDDNYIGNLPAGTYNWTIGDGNNCRKDIEVILTEPPFFSITLPEVVEIELGGAAVLQPQLVGTPAIPLTWEWIPATDLSCVNCPITTATPAQSKLYQLVAVDANGCTATDIVRVFVNRNCGVYVPNIFTPKNSADLNDLLVIHTGPCINRILRWQIFDRWGSLVFSQKDFPPNDLAHGWDGNARNKPAAAGVFTWYAQYEQIDGTVGLVTGDVTVWY
jgi:CHU_C Type IX secretion signal domain/SprB repeat